MEILIVSLPYIFKFDKRYSYEYVIKYLLNDFFLCVNDLIKNLTLA